MEGTNYGYKKSTETSSKLSRGPLAHEKVAIAMPGIIIVVLLIIGGNLWSTYGTGKINVLYI